MRHLFAITRRSSALERRYPPSPPIRSAAIRSRAPTPAAPPHYSGTVTVERTGDTYRVVWLLAARAMSAPASATKISSPCPTSPAATPASRFTAPTAATGGGVWTYAGAAPIGTEVWKRE